MPRAAEKITSPNPWDSYFLRQAACRNAGNTGFYPEASEKVHPKTRRVCESCPIQPDCLEYAVNHEGNGFWGGTTAEERVRIRRRRGIGLVDPRSINADQLRVRLRHPARFGPTQAEVDRIRQGVRRVGLEDLVHPADRLWDQTHSHGNNQDEPRTR